MYKQIYLRPLKQVTYENIFKQIKDRTGLIGIKTFNDSTIVPRGQIVGITNSANDNTIIDDIDYCCDIIPAEQECNQETVLYAGYYRHQWGHFLFNSTARLWWIAQDYQRLSRIDKFIFIATEGESTLIDGNYREFFYFLGILDKIHIIKNKESYKTIIVPDISFEHDVFFAREMLSVFNNIRSAVFREINNHVNINEYKNIFITRSGLKRAKNREINISNLDQLFSRNGYKIIHPECLKLSELILILENAENIVSISGSTAHNFIFSNEKSNKYILERCAQNNVFQINITKMTKQNVLHIDAFLSPTIPIPTGNVFFYFPTNQLNRFIEDYKLIPFSKQEIKNMTSVKKVYRFLASYKKQCGYILGLHGDFLELEPIAEAYSETLQLYNNCLKNSQIKYYLKVFLRKLKNLIKQ